MVSVIVPIYNVAPWIDECVESVLGQTHREFELLLVDDASTDDSGRICDKWAQRDSRVRVIHLSVNVGQSAARNRALNQANGAYLTYLDADDYLAPTFLETLLGLMSRHPECGMAISNVTVIRSGRQVPYGFFAEERVLSADEAIEAVLYDRMRTSCGATLYKTEAAQRVQFPEGRIHEDTYLIGDLIVSAGNVAVCPESLYFYRVRPYSTITRKYERTNMIQHLEAAQHLTEVADKRGEKLAGGCRRFRTFALLRALRYAKDVPASDISLRDSWRKQALKMAWPVLFDAKAPKRDKIGLIALFFGIGTYLACWWLYERTRTLGARSA